MARSPISFEAQQFGSELDDEVARMRREWFAPWKRIEHGLDVDNFQGGRIRSSGFRFDRTASLNFWTSVGSYLRKKLLQYAQRIEAMTEASQDKRRELEWLSVRLEGFINQVMGEARDAAAAAVGARRRHRETGALPASARDIMVENKRQLSYLVAGIRRRQLDPRSKLRKFFSLEFVRQVTLATLSAAFGFAVAWLLKP